MKNVKNGITYIELLLYIALIGVLISAVIPFTLAVIQNGEKSNTQREVTNAAYVVTEKIKAQIRNGRTINSGSSNFDVDLASSSANQISIGGSAPNDPILINVTPQGIAQIKIGANAAVALNPASTHVSSLVFKNNSPTDLRSKNLSFILTMTSSYAGSSPYYTYSITVRSAAELRSN